jgi:hypothetical protein
MAKKSFYKIGLILIAAVALPFAALAQDASDTISLPPNFVDTIWAQASLLFTSLAPYTNMIVGVVLALLVIGELILMLRGDKH